MTEENKTTPQTEALAAEQPAERAIEQPVEQAKPAKQRREPKQAPVAAEEKRGLKYMLRDIFSVLISAIVIAMLLKTFVVDTRMVPTGSMIPTINVGDRLIILKFPYYLGSLPEHQDIVVFTPGAEFDSKDDLIKRVIGLPGDTVEVRDNKVFVNGEALIEPYVNEDPAYVFPAVTVPEGCYFMMGDNRNRSRDSHEWLEPFVPLDDIKGQAVLCYWPLNRFGTIE